MSVENVEVVTDSTVATASVATVVVTLYNYREYVIRCLESVKAQTIEALDLVVLDDCSTDDGRDVVSEWLSKNSGRFGRSILARHKTNTGLPFARNAAFGLARTDYVFVLDIDNILYPRCLQQLVAGLDNCPTASFAYSYLEKFGADTGLHNMSPWRPASFQHGNTIDAMVLLRRSVWEAAGGYSTDMPVMGWEDFDLWFKIARLKGWGLQVPEILGRYFVHRDSMLRTVTNPESERQWAYLRMRYPEFFTDGSR